MVMRPSSGDQTGHRTPHTDLATPGHLNNQTPVNVMIILELTEREKRKLLGSTRL
jgi:hypothetical protein